MSKLKKDEILIQLTFKSGATIDFRCTRFTGTYKSFTWTQYPNSLPRLVDVNPDEIVAAVRIK